MSPRRGEMATAALGIWLLGVAAGCTSPEATRVRGGGPGADPNNRTEVVQMHEGSKPYYQTPRLIEPYGDRELAPAHQAHRLSEEGRLGR